MNLRQVSSIKENKNIQKETNQLCEHTWVKAGNDSHHDFYECTKCKDTLIV